MSARCTTRIHNMPWSQSSHVSAMWSFDSVECSVFNSFESCLEAHSTSLTEHRPCDGSGSATAETLRWGPDRMLQSRTQLLAPLNV